MTEQPYSQDSRVESLELKVTAIVPSAANDASPIELNPKKQYQTILSYQSDTKLQKKSNIKLQPVPRLQSNNLMTISGTNIKTKTQSRKLAQKRITQSQI